MTTADNIEAPDWLSLTSPPKERASRNSLDNQSSSRGLSNIVFPSNIQEMSSEMRQLEQQSFEIAFESLLEQIVDGRSLEEFCREYHTRLSTSRFRTWIYRDQRRKQTYVGAKAVGAEAVEDELKRISDGINANGDASMDDVARATLRINTRKWLLQVWNRRRYGDVKQIEQTTTTRFDPSSLSTQELQEKLLRSLGMEGSLHNVPDALTGEVFDMNMDDNDN